MSFFVLYLTKKVGHYYRGLKDIFFRLILYWWFEKEKYKKTHQYYNGEWSVANLANFRWRYFFTGIFLNFSWKTKFKFDFFFNDHHSRGIGNKKGLGGLYHYNMDLVLGFFLHEKYSIISNVQGRFFRCLPSKNRLVNRSFFRKKKTCVFLVTLGGRFVSILGS